MFFHAETTSNGIFLSGGGWTSKDISGDLTVSLEFTRCSLDLKFCEKWRNVNVKEICAMFVENKKVYGVVLNVVNVIKPKLECPIKSGNYTLDRTSLDFTALRMFPIEDHVWVITSKFISFDKVSKTKKVVSCMNTEVKITTGTRRLK